MLEKNENQFYQSSSSKVWNYSNKKVLICKDCIEILWKSYAATHGGEIATAICCAHMDFPFIPEVYRKTIESNPVFTIGLYSRQLPLTQNRNKTFANTITEGEFKRTEAEIREAIEERWSKEDKRNMKFAISVLGYDPFANFGMSDNDRKYCFNMLAGYFNNDSVKNDGHKLHCVVNVVQLALQCRKIDEEMNEELNRIGFDDKRIKDLTSSKTSLLASISTISKDNNLASAYNDSSRKGVDTLSAKMMELEENDYEAIKVNVFDIRTSAAFKQMMDLSNSSIIEQLSLDDKDYTEMIKEQRDKIAELESAYDTLNEEYRKIHNALELLKNKRGK